MNTIKLESVNSTNTYCNYLLTNPSGLPENIRPVSPVELPVAVIADAQYAGRGRYGKSFYSPEHSGVYLSYAYEGNYSETDLLKLTVVAASIVHQTLQNYCEDALTIKWINDIYRGSRKVAGILCERVDDPASQRYYIIIGVGINVFPAEIPEELSDIVGFLRDESSPELIAKISESLASELDAHLGKCRTSEFPVLVEYYRTKCKELPIDFADKLLNE